MSRLDNFMYGAKRCIDSATEKTNHFIETSKVKMTISQLNNNLKEEYTKLGKVCYDMSENGSDGGEKMSKIIAKINKIKEDIEIEKVTLSTFTEKICDVCGTSNDVKFQFCSKCGNKLD